MDNGKSKEMDMLHGPLFVKILVFALPLAASSILQQLFNSVDVAVVGRFASSEALAAVGSNAPVISLLVNLFLGLSMGANVVIANHIGQNDMQGIRKAISTTALLSVISGCFLLVVGVVVAKPILTMMGAPESVLNMAVTYLRIYFLGMPFMMIYDFGAAILRSRGDTRRPLYILIVAGIINTVFNLIFVICFGMGVAGVAIATGIANAVSALLIILILRKEPEPFRLHLKDLRIHLRELKPIIQIGIPAGLQGVIFSISNVAVQSAVNAYGAKAIAGSVAALNYEFYTYYVVEAFNGAAISFIGQNYGAGNKERVRRIYTICMSMSVLSCILCAFAFAGANDFFLNFFSTDPDVHYYGRIRLLEVQAFQAIACSYEISGSSLRGMGYSMLPTLIMVFGTCILRLIWVYALCPIWPGFRFLMAIYPVSWIITGSLVLLAFIIVFRRWQPDLSAGKA